MHYIPFGPEWFDHQREHFERHCETKVWGLLWEQGTAKTKPIIDTMLWLYANDEIDGMVVVAPPGVERNWLSDELPKHCPQIHQLAETFVWKSSKAASQNHKRKFDKLIKNEGLSILMISYNAFITKKAKAGMWRFLRRRVTLMVLDESHHIKTAKAKRTKSIIAAGKYAPYRRILTGTPVSKGPFDVYPQLRFLDDNFWKNRGIQNYAEYKAYFGEWEMREDVKKTRHYDPGFDRLIRYKNLDELNGYLAEITDRILKEDVLDLPPKLYSKRYFEMTDKQQNLYNELKRNFIAELDGEEVDGELAIVRLTRFQQIVCGYVRTMGDEDEENPIRMIDDVNPRINCLAEVCEQTVGQCLIWARYTKDIDQIIELLGDEAIRYDGTISADQCEINKMIFQRGEAKWFVGTAAKGKEGLNLSMAKTVIYYSNSFMLLDRLQSEDRPHRPGMDDNPINYIDICCPESVDVKIIAHLRDNVDIASQITGDKLREWI